MEKLFKSDTTIKKKKKIKKRSKNSQKSFSGSKFRYLNEYLYKEKSSEALKYFKNHKNDFKEVKIKSIIKVIKNN